MFLWVKAWSIVAIDIMPAVSHCDDINVFDNMKTILDFQYDIMSY